MVHKLCCNTSVLFRSQKENCHLFRARLWKSAGNYKFLLQTRKTPSPLSSPWSAESKNEVLKTKLKFWKQKWSSENKCEVLKTEMKSWKQKCSNSENKNRSSRKSFIDLEIWNFGTHENYPWLGVPKKEVQVKIYIFLVFVTFK